MGLDGGKASWMGGKAGSIGEQNHSSSDCWLYLIVGGSGQSSGG